MREIGSKCYVTSNISKLQRELRIFAGEKVTIRYCDSRYNNYEVDENGMRGYVFGENELTDTPPISLEVLCNSYNIKLDELRKEIKDTYLFFEHECTDEGIDKLLYHWLLNNEKNIQMMMEHPNYNGNLQVVVPVEIERFPEGSEIENAIINLEINTRILDVMRKKVNEEGQSEAEALLDDLKSIESSYEILSSLKEDKIFDVMGYKKYSQFTPDGYYQPSIRKADCIKKAIDVLRYTYINEIDTYYADEINSKLKKEFVLKKSEEISVGMKTSRAINRIFKLAGYESLPKDSEALKAYNHYFAIYSDMINAKKSKRYFVISLNPLDYLKMSFGNTWSSCHTIDANNKRNTRLTSSGTSTYTGMHMGGTLSYMLDETSFVSYMVNTDADVNHPDRSDKIYRNMFHFKDNILVQGRVYPQSKDGCTDLYKVFRSLIQENLCKMLGIEYICSGNGRDTWIKKGCSMDYSSIFSSTGAHYHDYTNFSDCNISYIRGNWKDNWFIEIGSMGICANCGKIIRDNDRISHYNCNSNF